MKGGITDWTEEKQMRDCVYVTVCAEVRRRRRLLPLTMNTFVCVGVYVLGAPFFNSKKEKEKKWENFMVNR